MLPCVTPLPFPSTYKSWYTRSTTAFVVFLLSLPSRPYYTREKMRLPPATHTRCPPMTPAQRLSARVVRTLYMLPLP
ncbi:unnamed protein product, partial [Ectocarpus sp. 12 AP-2014]